MEKQTLKVVSIVKKDELTKVLGLIKDDSIYVEAKISVGKYDVNEGQSFENDDRRLEVDTYLIEHYNVNFEDLDTLVQTEQEFYVSEDQTKASIYDIREQGDEIEEKAGSTIKGVIEIAEKRGDFYFIGFRTENGSLYKIAGLTTNAYVNELNQYFYSAKQEQKLYEKFEDLFGVNFEKLPETEDLAFAIGKNLTTKVGIFNGKKHFKAKDTKVAM